MEELEAVDWYDQRIDAAEDDELRAILVHNRDEEKEHASLILEWLRRRDATFDHELETYLFTEGRSRNVRKARKRTIPRPWEMINCSGSEVSKRGPGNERSST